MKWAVAPDGRRDPAHPTATGYTCPACQAAVFPKCGDHVEWHWAHTVGESSDCELGEGLDPDDFTGWHIARQTWAQEQGATIEAKHPKYKRKADIRTGAGIVIELQHSRLDRAVIEGREADWTPLGPMLWIWDAAAWGIVATRDPDVVLIPWKPIVLGTTPIFLDRGTHADPIGAGIHKLEWVTQSHDRGFVAARTSTVTDDVDDFIERLCHGENVPPSWFVAHEVSHHTPQTVVGDDDDDALYIVTPPARLHLTVAFVRYLRDQIDLDDEPFDRLVKAWAAWDFKPASEPRATEMEEACVAIAAELGCTTTDLRIALSQLRRKFNAGERPTLDLGRAA